MLSLLGLARCFMFVFFCPLNINRQWDSEILGHLLKDLQLIMTAKPEILSKREQPRYKLKVLEDYIFFLETQAPEQFC